MFVVVTLAAIGLGLIVVPAERQRRAVQAIRQVGGTVEYETDDNRQALVRAPQWLQTMIGEDYFRKVIEVSLRSKQISDSDLEHLNGLTSLRRLDLAYTQCSDTGLEHLNRLTALQTLDLSSTQISDAGLAHLQRLTALQWFDVNDTKISGAGLEHLKPLPALRYLNLNHTKTSAAALEHLQRLPALQTLDLGETELSALEVAELRAALPNCFIIYWQALPKK